MMNTATPIRSLKIRPARGVATLAATLIMLALSALVVLYTNRGQLFEQRISANQLRATTAFENADAGIEWALARLMDSSAILLNSACTPVPATTALSNPFRSFYVPEETPPASNPTSVNFTPPGESRAACAINETTGALTCDCPAPGTAPAIGAPGTRSFHVHFEDVATDPAAVRITSVGCVNNLNGTNEALCGALGSTPESTARITVLAKYVAGAGKLPRAALTAGGYINECSATNLINTDPISGGILMNSGGNTVVGQSTYMSGPLPAGARNCGGGPAQTMTTIPGSPISAAIFPNDDALAAASQSPDSMMMHYLGMSRDAYIDNACKVNSVAEIIARSTDTVDPCRRFWSYSDLAFTGNVRVGQNNPIIIATDQNITISGGSTIYGVVYSDRVYWEHNGAGAGTVNGVVIVRGSYYGNANLTINYNLDIVNQVTTGPGWFVKVPGSWRDFQN